MKRLSHAFYFLVLGGALAGIPALAMKEPIPGILSPFPVPFLLPVWILGPAGMGACALLAILFWCWSYQLRRNSPRIPKRSVVLAVVVTALSLAWTAWGFSDAAQWQGTTYAWTVAGLNIVVPLSLACLLRWTRAAPRWGVSFAFHWLLFAWLGSYAFAYLGETP